MGLLFFLQRWLAERSSSATASFVEYQGGGFSRADQERLRDVCLDLTERHVYVMLSNSATEYIKTLYSSEVFTIVQVRADRAISSKAATRGKQASRRRGNSSGLGLSNCL